MKRHLLLVVLSSGLLVAAPAWAQSPDVGVDHLARVELGAGFGMAGVFGGGAMMFPSAGVRVNITRRVAIDATATFDVGPYVTGLTGFYVLQAHHTLAPGQRVSPFATYGVLGEFTYRRQPEYRYALPTGDTVVVPAQTFRRMSRPFAVLGGGGARVRLAPHAFLETGAELGVAEGAVMAVVTVGVTIPIGGGR